MHCRWRVSAVALAGTLVLGACAGDDVGAGDPAGPSPAPGAGAAASPSPAATPAPAPSASPPPALPPDGQPGSAASLAVLPAGRAVRESPALTTLGQAVATVDPPAEYLEGPGPLTVFAPIDEAFAALPPDQVQALFADPARLAEFLRYHVVEGQALSAADLTNMAEVTTSGTVTVSPGGETVTLNDGQATVVFPDVEVANGVVHLVDGVLMPTP